METAINYFSDQQSHVDNAVCGFRYRGQESAGIVTSEGNSAKSFHVHKGMGMISNVFNDDSMKKLRGKLNSELFYLVKVTFHIFRSKVRERIQKLL